MAFTPYEQAVREILDRVSLVKVVSEHVPLKRFGRSHKGLCPFHQEKTPSFFVNEDRRVFYCFGCQTGGNAITFLKLAAGLSGREAVRRLAGMAGVTLPQDTPADPAEEARDRERSDLLHAAQAAREFFSSCLLAPSGRLAREYLALRGIPADLAQAFGLGYGGAHAGELTAELNQRRIPLRHAETLGLISRSQDPHSTPYERFRGRLVCPIFNLDGAPIGFSARLIPPSEDGPKYVNTPESLIFQKGEAVFGLHQARRAIRQKGFAVLVEGNFDCLSLVAAGLDNAVAPMGTSVTPAQMRLLKRFTERVAVMFDGDEAGRKASRRAVGLLIEAGLDGRIAALPDGEDPDSFARREGAAAVAEVIDLARPMVTYLLEALVAVHGRTPHGLRKVVEEAAEVFALERDSFRYGLYREELARCLGVDVRQVRGILRDPGGAAEAGQGAIACPAAERHLLELLLLHPRLIERFLASGDPSWFTHAEARQMLSDLLDAAVSRGEDPAESLAGSTEAAGGLKSVVARVLATPDLYPSERADSAFEDLTRNLKRKAMEREEQRLRTRLAAALAEGAPEEVVTGLQIEHSRAAILLKSGFRAA